MKCIFNRQLSSAFRVNRCRCYVKGSCGHSNINDKSLDIYAKTRLIYYDVTAMNILLNLKGVPWWCCQPGVHLHFSTWFLFLNIHVHVHTCLVSEIPSRNKYLITILSKLFFLEKGLSILQYIQEGSSAVWPHTAIVSRYFRI